MMLAGLDPALAERLAAGAGFQIAPPPAPRPPRQQTGEPTVSRDLEWWKRLDAELAEDSRTFLAAMSGLEHLDLSPLRDFFVDWTDRAGDESLDLTQRLRSRGIASTRRHADPTQARGLHLARQEAVELQRDATVFEEATAIHRVLFAAHPNVACQLREGDDRVLVSNAWLDGTSMPSRAFTDGDVVLRLEKLDHGLRRLEGELSPPLVAAAVYFDFPLIHPFLDGNGRTGRLLAERRLERLGVRGIGLLNIERRLDRTRALFEATLNLSRATHRPECFLGYWVKFLSQSAQDCERRARRMLRYVGSNQQAAGATIAR